LRLRGHEVLIFHTLAPEELTFSFNRWSRFECLEGTNGPLDLDPTAVRQHYLKRLKTFIEDLQQECLRTRTDLIPLSTDRPLGAALAHYLGRRSRTI
jgi:hypothetical protein